MVAISKTREYRLAYEKKHRAELKAAGICFRCGKEPTNGESVRCRACADKQNIILRRSNAKLRDETLSAYTETAIRNGIKFYKCKCKGCNQFKADPFVQIDHIDGNGAKHLQENGERYVGVTLYRWLRTNKFPPGYQVLCSDCNFAKGQNDNVCPHLTMNLNFEELQ